MKDLSVNSNLQERRTPALIINEERNNHPVERQMKTTAEEAVCGLNALLLGEARAHRTVGYKNSVSRYHMLVMSRCNELSNSLTDRTYRPEKGERHEVWEPRYRLTISSKYKDRVPQSSFVTNYFYPNVIPNLIENNCACIKGLGVDLARSVFIEMLRNADMDDWIVKADMQSYFASIEHEKLYEEMSSYITDPWAMWFYQTTVENTANPIGLDLGSEVYQLSATSFLNRMDHLFDNGNYIRYQDDLVIIGPKEVCKESLERIKQEAQRLGLTVSKKKTYAQPVSRPIKFLGFSYLKKPTGRVTAKRLPEKLRRERQKLRRMKKSGIALERVLEHYQCVRACLKHGSRSDVVKMDRYFNKLFCLNKQKKGMVNHYGSRNQEGKHRLRKETERAGP